MVRVSPVWWRLSLSAPVVRRAFRVAVVVGGLLVLVNHGDALLDGRVGLARVFQVIVTMFVPYGVSTYSSVRAIIERRGAAETPAPRPTD